MMARRVLWLTLAVAGIGWAQTMGAIEGTAYDPSGATMPGTMVKIVADGTHAERQATTDEVGRFLAPGLPPGTYTIEATRQGLRTEVRQGIEVSAGRAARVDLRFQLGEERDTIEVSSRAPLISVNTEDWGGTVGRPDLESLPLNGRDLFSLAVYESGATLASAADQSLHAGSGIHLSVNGARPNQNSFRMDGIYVNDAANSVPASAAGRTLGVDGIREIRVLSSPFGAENGRTMGAVFTAVSRSGTDEVHGSLSGFLRNSGLDAKNYFAAPDEPIPPLKN